MDAYQVDSFVTPLLSLMEGLTNWYIRRSRRRFWGNEMTEDKKCAYEVLYYTLVQLLKLYAPVAPILSEKLYRNLTGEASVHLADWPCIPEEYADVNLLEQVELVRRVIRQARSIREKQRVKNRQPLSLMQIALNDPAGNTVIREFAEIIKEELNVKDLEILDNVESIATVTYRPCFPVIGAKYAALRPQIIKAIQSGKFALAGGQVKLEIDGEEKAFDEDILLVSYNARKGMHVASEAGMVVSLDLTITEALRLEGVAREIVRNIQDARKSMNLNISDRIILDVNGSLPEGWADYICGETLASLGAACENANIITIAEANEGGDDLQIAICKA